LPLDQAKKGLALLKESGMKKINFAGGEPFIVDKGNYLGELVEFCKKELNIESTSIITNGSRVTEEWMARYS
jgi:radical S-adenosyl methionine domain-containing protein 2